MDQAMIRNVPLALAIAATLCLLAVPSIADDRPWEQERWSATHARSVPSEEHPFENRQWLEFQTRIDDRHEPEYLRGLRLGPEDNFVFSIQSPPVGEWAPGLAFEIHF